MNYLSPIVKSLVLFALLGTAPITAHAQGSGDEAMQAAALRQEIESANRAFEATFARGDAEGMASLYTRNGQLLPTGSRIVSGREAVAGFWQGAFDMGLTRAELETVEVEGRGDTAVEVGRYTLSGAGGQVMDRGKYIVVWKQEDGQWKLHRDIWNTSVAPGETAATVLKRTTISAPADEVWRTIRDFGGIDRYLVAVAGVELEGSGVGARRTLTLQSGGQVYERLEHRDGGARTLRYAVIRSPLPVKDYTSTMKVRALGENRSEVTWKAAFAPKGVPMAEAQQVIGGIFEMGFEGLKELHAH